MRSPGRFRCWWLREFARVLMAMIFSGLLCVVDPAALGQVATPSPGSVDLEFQPPRFEGGGITSILVAGDQQILIDGTFTSINGSPKVGPVRLNPDGSLDSSFRPPSSSRLLLGLLSEGKLLVVMTNGIARLLADGSLDPSWQGHESLVRNLQRLTAARQKDGKIVIGGTYTLVRLQANGSLDWCFTPRLNLTHGATDMAWPGVPWIGFAVVQPDQKILIGGVFPYVNGQSRQGLARLNADGSLDTDFNPFASVIGAQTTSLAVQPDGKVLVGQHINYSNRLVRLNPNGSLDAEFKADLGFLGSYRSVVVQPDGKMIVTWTKDLRRLNPDGSLDTGFASFQTDGPIWTTALQADGKVLIGGTVTNIQGASRINLARLHGDELARPPTITVQPLSQQILATQPLRLSVGVSGSAPEFQWRFQGSDLAGETNQDLYFAQAQLNQGGDYDVVVNNPWGSVTSAVATVKIEPPQLPAIDRQPAEESVLLGQNVALSVSASSPIPLAYQWQVNGQTISGATNRGLWLHHVQSQHAGDYQVVVGNAVGTVTSAVARLTVHPNHVEAGSVDLTLDPGSIVYRFGGDLVVNAVAAPSEGRIVVGGRFLQVQGQPRNFLAGLKADGSLDLDFHAAFRIKSQVSFEDHFVRSLAATGDGGFLAAISRHFEKGGFTLWFFGNYIARYDSARGCIDPTFHAEWGYYSDVNLFAQSDGRVLFAGGFTNINGVPKIHLARLTAQGALDPTFNLSLQVSAPIHAVAAQTDGKIIIGGEFTQVNGAGRVRLARLTAEGTVDPDFNPEAGPDAPVRALALQGDGKIIIGGDFVNYRGFRTIRVARLNPDASPDLLWDIGPTGSVRSVAVQLDGDILVAGKFSAVGTLPRAGLARFYGGTLDLSARPPTISLQPSDQKVLAGQSVTFSVTAPGQPVPALQWMRDGVEIPGATASSLTLSNTAPVDTGGYSVRVSNPLGVETSRVARLTIEFPFGPGKLDTSFYSSYFNLARSSVTALAIQPDGKILAGGHDGYYVRLQPNGQVDEEFVRFPDFAGPIFSIVIQSDQKILLGGGFRIGGNQTFLVRLEPDGRLDESFAPQIRHSPFGPSIKAIAIQPDGKIVIGGYFLTVNGVKRNMVARLLAAGSLDQSFDPGTGASGTVLSIALQTDGKILLGGNFRSFNGQTASGLVRLDPQGSFDTTLNYGGFAENIILTIVVQPDQKILVGGLRFDRLHPDGTLDTSFVAPLSGVVEDIALQPDGKILVSGVFRSGVPDTPFWYGLARLEPNGSLDSSFAVVESNGRSAFLQDGNILFAGAFAEVHGIPRPKLARLFGDQPFRTPALGELSHRGNVTVLSVPAISGRTYTIQYNDLLSASGWHALTTIPGNNTIQAIMDTNASPPQRFYRLLQDP